jgi:hypothetical protein
MEMPRCFRLLAATQAYKVAFDKPISSAIVLIDGHPGFFMRSRKASRCSFVDWFIESSFAPNFRKLSGHFDLNQGDLFALSIRNSFNQHILNAKLDSYYGDKITDDMPFFNAIESSLAITKRHSFYLCASYNVGKKTMDINEKLMELVNKEWKSGHVVDFIKSQDASYRSVKFISRAYFICGEEHVQINGMCILNYDELPPEYKEICQKQFM